MADVAAYVEAFGDINKQRDVQTSFVMSQALEDPSLSDLERYVLGVTGSQSALTTWRILHEAVSDRVGEPLLALREKDSLFGAKLGRIAGEATVVADLPQEPEPRTPHLFGIYLNVPVQPVVIEQFHGGSTVDEEGSLTIASFTADGWRYGRGNPLVELDAQNYDLTIGREKLYSHPLFQRGVHGMLLRLEQAQAEQIAV